MGQAFQLQTQMDQLARAGGQAVNPDGSAGGANPIAQLPELQAQLQQLLGPDLWQNWSAGRNLRVNLDP